MSSQWRTYLSLTLGMLGLIVWSGCDYVETYLGSSCGPQCSHLHDCTCGADDQANDDDNDEGHTHVGPNGGRLIVLGDEDYHAELRINHETAEATVCVLDHTGRRPVCADHDEINLNIRFNGQPHQIRLNAVNGDAAEVIRSRFSGTSELLRSECQLDGRLNIAINGKPYSGRVAHGEDDHKLIR
jgi:hypothetical protein